MRFSRNAMMVLAVLALSVAESVAFRGPLSLQYSSSTARHLTTVLPARIVNNKKKYATANDNNRLSANGTASDFNSQLQSMLKSEPSRAEQAEQELLQRIQSEKASYNVASFNIILQAWARQQSVVAANRADALLQTLKAVTQPDSYSYSAVLNALAKSKGGRRAALRAQELVEELEVSGITITNDICHSTLMNTWAGQPDGGQKCGQILEQLEQKSIATLFAYNACIKAWMRTRDPLRAGPEAHKILDRLKVIAKTNPHLAPDKITYTSTINAWVPHQDPVRASQKADALLREMETLSLTHPDKGPDIITYTSVLSAMAKAGNPAAATDILQRMETYGNVPANVPFCNALINVFAKSNVDGESAEAVLRHMETQGLQPDKITYSAVIATYANHGNATMAMLLLDELQHRWETSREDRLLPNSQIFLSVLYALSKSQSPNALERASELLDRLKVLHAKNPRDPALEPDRLVYSQLFQILCHSTNSDRAATRAMELLEDMKALHRRGCKSAEPDATTYAYVVTALSKSGSADAADRALEILDQVETKYAETGAATFQPTPLLYSSVLQAFAKSSTAEGAQRAETLLRRNLDLFASGKDYARPTTQCYNAVIDAHARSGTPNAADVAEAILTELESSSLAQPNSRSYNAVILALKNSDGSPAKAEHVLKRMNNRYKKGNRSCRPDQWTINSIIALLAKHGEASRALDFLGFLEESSDASLKPNLITYNSVLDAIARSGWKDAGPRANELYQRMVQLAEKGELDTKPDAATYASLRHAWTKTKGGQVEADRMHQAMENAKAHSPQTHEHIS